MKNAASFAAPMSMFAEHAHEGTPKQWSYLEDELFIQTNPELKEDLEEPVIDFVWSILTSFILGRVIGLAVWQVGKGKSFKAKVGSYRYCMYICRHIEDVCACVQYICPQYTCSSVLLNSFKSVQSLLLCFVAAVCLVEVGLFCVDRSVFTLVFLQRSIVTPPSPPSHFLLSVFLLPHWTQVIAKY